MQTHFSRALRAYVSLSVGVTAAIAIFDPTRQHREAFEGGASLLTLGSLASMAFLLAIALAGALDVVINDLLPERFSIDSTHRHRHVVFMLMAIGQVALMWLMVKANPGEWPPVLARYVLDAAFAVGIAIAGVRDHYFRRVYG
ncbi:hypothetical protein GT347_16135 [Xylophilus rhododendri]|uniref:Uncharacterized protein n=1 Tax=Xylophilus rhododendri TaxID=2697032 RepID=A0A857J834_9BURK|nr:hypothetical protein [Xylophilus rhododendri]QHI99373.1 hypothetical protein GT347_16135 [Xylophilus rhododendri]